MTLKTNYQIRLKDSEMEQFNKLLEEVPELKMLDNSTAWHLIIWEGMIAFKMRNKQK